MKLIAIVLLLGGCATSRWLDKEALNHEQRAQAFAERGDGMRAQAEEQKADNLRATASLRAQLSTHQHYTWINQ